MAPQKSYYQRHLPHFQPSDAELFVTFRLAGSLPFDAIERLKSAREEEQKFLRTIPSQARRRDAANASRHAYFEKYEQLLDGTRHGPRWLVEDPVAEVVSEAIHYRDGKEYDLFASTLMPNHVHMVYSTVGRNDIPTYKILQSLKRHTARRANTILGQTGSFWQDESYDHVIRSPEELERIVWYIVNNPVKAGLVETWQQWKWTYVKEGLL
jgi:REP element-mobilizing transposase RayT